MSDERKARWALSSRLSTEARATVGVVGTNAGVLLLGATSGILTSRILGPSGKGELATVVVWISMLAALGTLGVPEALIFYSAAEPESRGELLFNGLVLAAAQSLVVMGLGALVVRYLLADQSATVVRGAAFFIWFVPLNYLAIYPLGVLQGSSRFGPWNRMRISMNIVNVLGLIVLVLTGRMTVHAVILVLLLANLVTALLCLSALALLVGLKPRLAPAVMGKLIRYGLKVHIGTLSANLNQRLDQMLIGVMLPAAQLGLYAAAATLSGMGRVVALALNSVTFPRMATTLDRERQRAVFTRAFRITAALSLAVTGCGIVLAPWIIRALFGDAFLPAVPVFRLLALGSVLLDCGSIMSASLRGMGDPVSASIAEVIGTVVMIIGLALVLQYAGIIGAGIALLLAHLASFLYQFHRVSGRLGISAASLIGLSRGAQRAVLDESTQSPQ